MDSESSWVFFRYLESHIKLGYKIAFLKDLSSKHLNIFKIDLLIKDGIIIQRFYDKVGPIKLLKSN